MSSPRLRGALSREVARVMGSRFAKPIARVILVAMGLILLAAIGRAGSAGAFGGSPAAALLAADASTDLLPAAASLALPLDTPATGSSALPAHPHASQGSASPDDPVILNTAEADDLRRLPGIGPKRADAILALRAHLGRFHAIEDLLRVKGVGRATLKRLRPLVRLDPPALPRWDGGAPTAKG